MLLLAGSPAAWSGDFPVPELAERLAQQAKVRIVGLQELDNQKLGESEEAHFALAGEAAVRRYTAEHPDTKVRVVGHVAFIRYLHILVRSPLQIRRPEDFRSLRLGLGDPASAFLAGVYFDHLGIPLTSLPDQLVQLPGPPEKLSAQLQTKDLDVALVAAGLGHPSVCVAVADGAYVLLPLDYETRRSFVAPSGGAGFASLPRVAEIPPRIYAGQRDPVPTIAMNLLLLAQEGQPSERARQVLAEAQEIGRDLRPSGACGREEDATGLRQDAGFLWLEKGRLMSSRWSASRRIGFYLLLAAAALGLLVLAWKRGLLAELRSYWGADKLPFLILLALAGSIAAVTVATHLFEKDVNEKFSTIPESFWSITIYLFSGLEDRTPYTAPGRFIATLGLLLGPAFFAVMSGWLARFFIRREKKMPQNLRNHYLLLNWNERAVGVVREIHQPILLANDGPSVIVLLTDQQDLSLQKLKEAGSGQDEAFEDFYLSIGDPTSERGLLNANAQDARAIVIFADEGQGDERTFRSIFALRRIARERGITSLHVVAELLDPANTPILDEMARDFPGLLERVSNTELRMYLLAQAAMNPGIVRFYTDLLRTTGDTNELYSLRVPEGATGIDFAGYAAFLYQARLPEPLVPVGIQRVVEGRATMITNPRPEDPASVLRLGDRLLVFAYLPPAQDILPVPAPVAVAAASA